PARGWAFDAKQGAAGRAGAMAKIGHACRQLRRMVRKGSGRRGGPPIAYSSASCMVSTLPKCSGAQWSLSIEESNPESAITQKPHTAHKTATAVKDHPGVKNVRAAHAPEMTKEVLAIRPLPYLSPSGPAIPAPRAPTPITAKAV